MRLERAGRQEGFRPLAEVVARHACADAAELLGTYFRLGDPGAFTVLCTRSAPPPACA